MQNKANFRKVKLNVNQVLTTDYVQMDTWSRGKTKPIQSQSKPIQSQLKPILCQNKPNSNPIQTQFQSQKMLLRMTIKPRRDPLGNCPDWRFFAVDQGPNLSCFEGPLWSPGLILSEKKPQLPEIPDKAGAGLCRFVYIRKALHLFQEQGIITVDFRLRIEKNTGK